MRISIRRLSDFAALAAGDGTLIRAALSDDPHLVAERLPRAASGDPKDVLLLGATGFVGLHLLHALLASDRVAKVRVVIRVKGAASPTDRLGGAAKRFRMDLPNLYKLEILTGDVDQPMLGLDAATWQRLRATVDCVVNGAGLTSHTKPYLGYRRTSIATYLRLCEFCLEDRLKSLHTIGSIGSEVFRKRSDFFRIGFYHCGYSRMKWVLKHLTMRLSAHGVPTSVYLAPFVLGGNLTAFRDPSFLYSFWHMIAYILRVGAMWQGDGAFVPGIPGDMLARSVVDNMLSDTPAAVVHPPMIVRNEALARSLSVSLVDWESFRQRLAEAYPLVPVRPARGPYRRGRRQRFKDAAFARALFPSDFPVLLDAISRNVADAGAEGIPVGYDDDFIARGARANSILRPIRG